MNDCLSFTDAVSEAEKCFNKLKILKRKVVLFVCSKFFL